MDEQKLNRMSFDEVISIVDQLSLEERKQIGRGLDFKSLDAAWKNKSLPQHAQSKACRHQLMKTSTMK